MKVLALTDFSENSIKALNFGLTLFKDAEFIIAHSYESDEVDDSIYNETEERLKKKIDEIIENANHSQEITKVVTTSNLESLVKRFEDRKNADLILMGTKGLSSVKKNLMGSNAKMVAKSTSIPVLAVPEVYIQETVENIVLAIDYKNFNQDNEILMPLANLARLIKAKVKILSIITDYDNDSNIKSISEVKNNLFKEVDISWHFITADDIIQAIEDFCEEHNADLLSVISKDRNLIQRLFHDSITEELIGRAKLPILALEED